VFKVRPKWRARSTGALASLGFWDIDVLIVTQKGQPVAMLRGLDDDSHVKTRISRARAKLLLWKSQGTKEFLVILKHGISY